MSVYEIHECIYAKMCVNDMEAPMVLIDGSELLVHTIFRKLGKCRTCSIRPGSKLNIDIPKAKYQQSGLVQLEWEREEYELPTRPQEVRI
jgi:hypothetical protein